MSEDGHEAGAEGAREHVQGPRGARAVGRPLPLNSKRLTSVYVQTIARAMELPMKGSVAETRQMIEGKLSDVGREPTNVQVIIQEDEDGAEQVSLTDVLGVFLGPEPILYPREEVSGGGRAEDREEPQDDEGADQSVISRLEEELAESRARNKELEAKVSSVSGELARVKARVDEIWRINCAQVAAFDETITAKDTDIERLTVRVAELEARLPRASDVEPARVSTHPSLLPHTPPVPAPSSEILVATATVPTVVPEVSAPVRRGKAPPVSAFLGEDLECQLDDWLPSLERASTWNAWTADERAMQLAGHLKGRALQEYNLLRPEEKESFESAVHTAKNKRLF